VVKERIRPVEWCPWWVTGCISDCAEYLNLSPPWISASVVVVLLIVIFVGRLVVERPSLSPAVLSAMQTEASFLELFPIYLTITRRWVKYNSILSLCCHCLLCPLPYDGRALLRSVRFSVQPSVCPIAGATSVTFVRRLHWKMTSNCVVSRTNL